MAKRIYLVVNGDKERLIEADNRAQALSYAVKTTIKAAVATQSDLVRLVQHGTAVESAGDESAE